MASRLSENKPNLLSLALPGEGEQTKRKRASEHCTCTQITRPSEQRPSGQLLTETYLTQYQVLHAETPVVAFHPLILTDKEVAHILTMTVEWVRSHADEIPGLQRLGNYYRFRTSSVEQWLGSLDPVLEAEQAAALLQVPGMLGVRPRR